MLSYLVEAIKGLPFEIVVCGSLEADKECVPTECHYVYAENIPLTDKMNTLFQACKTYEGVMLLGSDDLMSREMLEYYAGLPSSLSHVLGLNDIYFYLQKEGTLHYFHGQTHGAGRYFSKKVLKKLRYTPYEGTAQKHLDTICRRKLDAHQIDIEHISMAETNGILVDVKWQGNITSEKITYICEEVNSEIMAKAKLPKAQIDALPKQEENKPFTAKAVAGGSVLFESNGDFFAQGTYTMATAKAEYLENQGYGKIIK